MTFSHLNGNFKYPAKRTSNFLKLTIFDALLWCEVYANESVRKVSFATNKTQEIVEIDNFLKRQTNSKMTPLAFWYPNSHFIFGIKELLIKRSGVWLRNRSVKYIITYTSDLLSDQHPRNQIFPILIDLNPLIRFFTAGVLIHNFLNY